MSNKSTLASLYYALAVVGFLATWYYNWQYIVNGGGLGPNEFFGAAFANLLTAAITIDVYLSALVFSVWVLSDSRRLSVKWPWLYVVLCFSIGLAISFPLYLASREKAIGGDQHNAYKPFEADPRKRASPACSAAQWRRYALQI